MATTVIQSRGDPARVIKVPRLAGPFSPCPVMLSDGRICGGTIDMEWARGYHFCHVCGHTWDMTGRPLDERCSDLES